MSGIKQKINKEWGETFAVWTSGLLGCFFFVACVFVFICLYFLPTLIAIELGARLVTYAIFLNVFFGWTGIGWLVAIGLALY